VRRQDEPFAAGLTFTYDAAGNRTLTEDSLGGVTVSQYDELGRLRVRQLGSTRIDLEWTPRSQVATVTYSSEGAAAVVGHFEYDALARVHSQTSWVPNRPAPITTIEFLDYGYDPDDRLTSERRMAWRDDGLGLDPTSPSWRPTPTTPRAN
jgi:YD repeat-containing protein